jgi:hypothetical protein
VNGAKTIATVGVSEQEVAHLRLLLRKCERDLNHAWRWGDEGGADLVVVDVRSFAGQMARTRAHGTGVRYAIFSEVSIDGVDLVLKRPLQLTNVVAVLNKAANANVRDQSIGANTPDFYTRDLGESIPVSHWPDSAAAVVAPSAVKGLDELLRPEPAELRSSENRAPVAPSPLTTAATALGASEEALTRSPANVVVPRTYATRESMLADTAPRDLRAFLGDDLLRVPARFTLAGAPPLTLDPKNKVAHAPAGLAAMAPYCRNRWRLCDWQPVTNADLADVRATQTALSYARLTWLQVLLQSGGHLASHLDPGGTYRLKQWVEVDKELGRYFRIASAMLQPSRLHEIAAASSSPMADVFDMVNAYDAIGLIEWQPRPRRNDDEKKPSNLLGRLRKPFGKA